MPQIGTNPLFPGRKIPVAPFWEEGLPGEIDSDRAPFCF